MIKLFVDDCSDVTVTVRCQLITQHIEVGHCERTEIDVAVPVQTVQVDLSSDVTVRYRQNVMAEGHKVYHAGVKGLVVKRDLGGASTAHNYQTSLLEENAGDQPKEEVQFLTHLKRAFFSHAQGADVANLARAPDGELKTERVRRAHGMMPLTDEELSRLAGSEEIDGAGKRQALDKKTVGLRAGKHLLTRQPGAGRERGV
jgi:hypothetical protein